MRLEGVTRVETVIDRHYLLLVGTHHHVPRVLRAIG